MKETLSFITPKKTITNHLAITISFVFIYSVAIEHGAVSKTPSYFFKNRKHNNNEMLPSTFNNYHSERKNRSQNTDTIPEREMDRREKHLYIPTIVGTF